MCEGRAATGDEEGGHDEQQQRTRRETKALGIAKDKTEPGRRDDDGDDAQATPGESGNPTGTPATTCSMAWARTLASASTSASTSRWARTGTASRCTSTGET